MPKDSTARMLSPSRIPHTFIMLALSCMNVSNELLERLTGMISFHKVLANQETFVACLS